MNRRQLIVACASGVGIASYCQASTDVADIKNAISGRWNVTNDDLVTVRLYNYSTSRYLLRLTGRMFVFDYSVATETGQERVGVEAYLSNQGFRPSDGWLLLWSGTRDYPSKITAVRKIQNVSFKNCDPSKSKISISVPWLDFATVARSVENFPEKWGEIEVVCVYDPQLK